jgi:hypothetical protein
MKRRFALLSVLPVLVVLFTDSAKAQAQRTYVSGVGDDANPCSRTAPCKTFAGAISKTSAFGEINTLDPGGFGAVTITKSITISNEGTGESGVIDGLNTSLSGINFLTQGTLNVERCQVFEFNGSATTGAGINFQPSGTATLNVLDTGVYNNAGSASLAGILIQPQSGGSATGFLNRVRVYDNAGDGIRFDGTITGALASTFTIRDSEFNGSGAAGIHAISATAATNVMVDNAVVSNNATFGVRAQQAATFVRLTNSTVTGNATGLAFSASGTLASFSNNSVNGNGTDGAPSTTVTYK